MTLKRYKCRDHGGIFTIESRRGRPPVRCSEAHPCNAHKIETPSPKAPVHKAVANRTTPTKLSAPAEARKAASEDTPSLVGAKAAKEFLTTNGWIVRGKGWHKDGSDFASVTATRGEEMIYIIWREGVCVDQQYSLWRTEKPSANGKPESKLTFDPDEVPDAELAQLLVGSKVTWYNRLAGRAETAYCGRERITIEHGYNATGDETPGERIIKFIDADGQGFRAFRLDALLKVGK